MFLKCLAEPLFALHLLFTWYYSVVLWSFIPYRVSYAGLFFVILELHIISYNKFLVLVLKVDVCSFDPPYAHHWT